MFINQFPGAKPRFFYGYIVVFVAFFLMAIMWGTLQSFGVFLKPLSTELGWTRAMVSAAYSLSFIVFGLITVVAGKLCDRFGPRMLLTICGLLFGSGYLLVSQVGTIWQLYLLYGLPIGIGMSGSMAPLTSTVARWFTKNRGLMIGITVSGIGVGLLVVPPLATFLMINHGWRTTYLLLGIIILALILPLAQFLRRDPSQIGQLPYGDRELQGISDLYQKGFSLKEAIHTQQFWIVEIVLFFYALMVGIIMVHIVPHAIGLGLSASGAAVILAVIGGFSTGSRVITGSTGDRIGYKPVLIICFTSISISLFLLLVAKDSWMLYLFACMFGLGQGGGISLISPLVAELFGLDSLGIIFGVIMIGGTTGMAISPVIAGHMFDTMGSYNLIFIINAGISIIALLLLLLLKPTSRMTVGLARRHN
ncbi:MFS transporter [Chloroflexota bacterium]